MIITDKKEEKDFLTYHLFTASKSERIKKKRRRNKISFPIYCLAFGVLPFSRGEYLWGIGFTLVGVLWFFLYPLWEKGIYVKHYKGFLSENIKEANESDVTLKIEDDFIEAKTDTSESKISTKEIEEINEIPHAIYIRLKSAQSFIIPKDKIKEVDALLIRLKELAKSLNINYNIYNNWSWK